MCSGTWEFSNYGRIRSPPYCFLNPLVYCPTIQFIRILNLIVCFKVKIKNWKNWKFEKCHARENLPTTLLWHQWFSGKKSSYAQNSPREQLVSDLPPETVRHFVPDRTFFPSASWLVTQLQTHCKWKIINIQKVCINHGHLTFLLKAMFF